MCRLFWFLQTPTKVSSKRSSFIETPPSKPALSTASYEYRLSLSPLLLLLTHPKTSTATSSSQINTIHPIYTRLLYSIMRRKEIPAEELMERAQSIVTHKELTRRRIGLEIIRNMWRKPWRIRIQLWDVTRSEYTSTIIQLDILFLTQSSRWVDSLQLKKACDTKGLLSYNDTPVGICDSTEVKSLRKGFPPLDMHWETKRCGSSAISP